MKRFKNSSNPEPKKSIKWKLKPGITWEMIHLQIQLQGEMTEEVLEKYFDKIVD